MYTRNRRKTEWRQTRWGKLACSAGWSCRLCGLVSCALRYIWQVLYWYCRWGDFQVKIIKRRGRRPLTGFFKKTKNKNSTWQKRSLKKLFKQVWESLGKETVRFGSYMYICIVLHWSKILITLGKLLWVNISLILFKKKNLISLKLTMSLDIIIK